MTKAPALAAPPEKTQAIKPRAFLGRAPKAKEQAAAKKGLKFAEVLKKAGKAGTIGKPEIRLPLFEGKIGAPEAKPARTGTKTLGRKHTILAMKTEDAEVAKAAEENPKKEEPGTVKTPRSKPEAVQVAPELLQFSAGRQVSENAEPDRLAPKKPARRRGNPVSGGSRRNGADADGITGLKKPSLTGSARRVEIVDERELPDAGPSPKAAGIRQGRRDAALNAPRPAAAGEIKFASVETEIGLPAEIAGLERIGGKGSDVRAAVELARRLDAEAGNEIVRQVKVVLSKADAGEVQISLRPERLGRVRFEIRMEDNRLAGRVFVESAAAREAFRSALDGLQAKLVESGFGSADLELAWDEGTAANPREQGQSRRRTENPARAAEEFENMTAAAVGEAFADSQINMVV